MASASGRSRSSRRISPPGVAEQLRSGCPMQLRAEPGLLLTDDAGSGAEARRPSYLPCASAARCHRYGWICREATMTDVRQKRILAGRARPCPLLACTC